MKCPSCKSSSLDWLNLEPELPARGCSSCEGAWIARVSYDAWRAKQAGDAPAKPARAEIDVTDVRHAKLCPQCSQLMQKYHVSHDLAFYLDSALLRRHVARPQRMGRPTRSKPA